MKIRIAPTIETPKPIIFSIYDDNNSTLFTGTIIECESWVRIKERETNVQLTLDRLPDDLTPFK